LAPGGEVVDEFMVRLDLDPERLRAALLAGRLAVGGAHCATAAEMQYAPNAIVPDLPERLSVKHYDLMLPLLSGPATPHSLRVGFGSMPPEIDVQRALAEISAEGDVPSGGSVHELGPYGAGWLLDILHNYPGETTTIIPRAAFKHPSPGTDTTRYIGVHYDQQSRRPDGWEERLPISSRIKAGRRIIVNLGDGQRTAIAAINFSALQFGNIFAPGDPDYLPRTIDLVSLMSSRPDLLATMALLHIVIKPGEVAEITAANSAHDGSMLGCDQKSTSLIFSMGKSPVRP
jgi:hypothetical protein